MFGDTDAISTRIEPHPTCVPNILRNTKDAVTSMCTAIMLDENDHTTQTTECIDVSVNVSIGNNYGSLVNTSMRRIDQTESECLSQFTVAPLDTGVVNFLRQKSPSMLSELTKSSESKAFKNYELSKQDCTAKTVKYEYALSLDLSDENISGATDLTNVEDCSESKTHTRQNTLEVTGISWGSSGVLLAATFGKIGCDWASTSSDGVFAVWDLSARIFRPDRPVYRIRHNSSLTCVAAHPEYPSVFGSGSSCGEVLLYDLTEENPAVGCSKFDGYIHKEMIVAVVWSYCIRERNWQLCSMSKDGKIMFWNRKNDFKYPLRGIDLVGDEKDRIGLVGFNSLTAPLKKSHQGDFFVGGEDGKVIKVSPIDQAQHRPQKCTCATMKWSTSALQALSRVPQSERNNYVNLVEQKAKATKKRGVDLGSFYSTRLPSSFVFPLGRKFAYADHAGSVSSVDKSPFHRNLFLSCGADGEVKVYSIFRENPLLVMYPPTANRTLSKDPLQYLCARVMDAKFSQSKATIICCACDDGNAYMYNLEESMFAPAAILTPPSIINGDVPSVTKVMFNEKIKSLLATGDSNGVLHIWRIPSHLSSQKRTDQEFLEKILKLDQ
mmetsp:Transcript_41796/g.50114  ORF Transcript_41796/g.50114 Transcript_41796/m.50114 type:complete len:608 (-) Transcript_41796:290-2113(-)